MHTNSVRTKNKHRSPSFWRSFDSLVEMTQNLALFDTFSAEISLHPRSPLACLKRKDSCACSSFGRSLCACIVAPTERAVFETLAINDYKTHSIKNAFQWTHQFHSLQYSQTHPIPSKSTISWMTGIVTNPKMNKSRDTSLPIPCQPHQKQCPYGPLEPQGIGCFISHHFQEMWI